MNARWQSVVHSAILTVDQYLDATVIARPPNRLRR